MLSICDVIVSQKVPMENESSISLGGQKISVYEKGIKNTENKSMETTEILDRGTIKKCELQKGKDM